MAPDSGARERFLKHGSPWRGQTADRCPRWPRSCGRRHLGSRPGGQTDWPPTECQGGARAERGYHRLGATLATGLAGARVPAQGPAGPRRSAVTTLPTWLLLSLSAGTALVTTPSGITGPHQTMATLCQALAHTPGTRPRALRVFVHLILMTPENPQRVPLQVSGGRLGEARRGHDPHSGGHRSPGLPCLSRPTLRGRRAMVIGVLCQRVGHKVTRTAVS